MIGLLDDSLKTADPSSTEEPTVAIEAAKALITLLKAYSKYPSTLLTLPRLSRSPRGRRIPFHRLPLRKRSQASEGTEPYRQVSRWRTNQDSERNRQNQKAMISQFNY